MARLSEHNTITRAVEIGRRMRTAIFDGAGGEPVSNAREILESVNGLARLAGQIAVAHALDNDTDTLIAALDASLQPLEQTYGNYPIMMSSLGSTRSSPSIATGVLLMADGLHANIEAGHYPVMTNMDADFKTQQELDDQLAREPYQVAPLTADLFMAHVVSMTLAQHASEFGGKVFEVVPAAVNQDGSRVLLPEHAPTSNYGVYTDGRASGQTYNAVAAALQANAQQP